MILVWNKILNFWDNWRWDQQFKRDARVGKLDKLAAQAIKDFKNGNYKKV